MKKFSGNKAYFGEMISIKPPMKGGHRHNHVRNVMARRRKCKKGWRNCAVCGARFHSTHHNIFCSKYCAEL